MRLSIGEKIFSYIITALLIFVSLLALYPFIYVLSSSFSNSEAVVAGKILLTPIGFSLEAYKKVFATSGLWIAYGNTFFYTIFGTVFSVLITIFGAYPLSKKRLRGRKILTIIVTLTLWFQPGIIPNYLNFKDLGMLDNRLGVILALACSTFYVILMRTYFESIPEAMEESAKIDGANDIHILYKIILPFSIPIIATISLYYAVSRWNGYFWAMILLSDENKIPIQVLLKKLIVDMQTMGDFSEAMDSKRFSKETIIYATIVITSIPIVAVYPFIQKYFIKGIMVGAVKG